MSNSDQRNSSRVDEWEAIDPISARDIVVDAVRFDSERDSQPKPFRGPLEALLGTQHAVRESKLGTPCFSLAIYETDSRRGNDHVVALTAISVDYDHITGAQVEQVISRARDYACVIYSTFSDRVGGSDDRCIRVIFPSSRPITPEEHLLVRNELVREIGVGADDAATDPARIWFVPACPSSRMDGAFVMYVTARLFDPQPYLGIAEAMRVGSRGAETTTPGDDASRRSECSRSATTTGIAKLKARLERLRDPDSHAAVTAVMAGEPFASRGSRDATLWRIMSTAAFVAPDADPAVLLELVTPSLNVMAEQEPEDHLTVEDAADMARRALADARAAKVRVFERGDEVEIAGALVEALTADGDLVHSEGEFYQYDASSGLFEIVQREELSRTVQQFAGRLIIGRDGSRVLRISRGIVDGALRLGADRISNPSFFDGAPRGVAFRNGFVTVTREGIEVEPNGPSNRARTALPFDYDPCARCERFDQFQDEVFLGDEDATDKKAALAEFAGACLLGLATAYARAIVLLGPGRNGKSVFIDILLALFPESARAAVPPQVFESDYHRALLAGKLINSVAELPRADILRGEAFKAIVAGDIVTARQIYRPPITFRPRAGHVMAANQLPLSDDLTVAFWERVLIIQFNRIFAQHERDKTLTRRIVGTELPGVAAWALRGAEALLRRGDQGGFTEPSSHAGTLAAWRLRADQVRQYLGERTRPTTDPRLRVQARWLYADYREWAKDNGHKQLSNPTFGERVNALGIRRVKPHSQAFYELELVPQSGVSPTLYRGTARRHEMSPVLPPYPPEDSPALSRVPQLAPFIPEDQNGTR